jgi:hypothetical protein
VQKAKRNLSWISLPNEGWPCLTVWQVLLSEPEIDLHASFGGVKNSPIFLALHNRHEGIVQVSLASLLNQARLLQNAHSYCVMPQMLDIMHTA